MRVAKLEGALEPAAVSALRQVLPKIRDKAKQIVPVDTGSLQQSIRLQTYARRGKTYRMGVSAGGYVTNPRSGRKVNYAAHVEYGTSRTRAQPYMRPALQEYKRELRRIIIEKIRR